jgi:hypothetical protein
MMDKNKFEYFLNAIHYCLYLEEVWSNKEFVKIVNTFLSGSKINQVYSLGKKYFFPGQGINFLWAGNKEKLSESYNQRALNVTLLPLPMQIFLHICICHCACR